MSRSFPCLTLRCWAGSLALGLSVWMTGCQCADGIPDPVDARRDASLDTSTSVDSGLDANASDAPMVDARPTCRTNAECQDSTFCNGAERCAPTEAGADMNGCVVATEPRCMATQTCDEDRAMCLTECDVDPDADNDTFNAIACGGDDCDDSIPTIFPGAMEVCDGVDQNCVMGADEGFNVGSTCDPVGLCGIGIVECLPSLLSGCSTGPGGTQSQVAAELCNGLDEDCDGASDETFALGDACDGIGECGTGVRECNGAGGARCSTDRGGSADGSTPERCDALDQDCDGDPLNGLGVGTSCDGVGSCGIGMFECGPSGVRRCSTDIGGSMEQSMPEVCDGADNNCNGGVDEGNPGGGASCTTALPGVCAAGTTACAGGSIVCNGTFLPGSQPELCDSVDNDCSGAADDANPNVMCAIQNPGAAFVSTWSCAGTCAIGACASGRADIDGGSGNGCECATDAYATSCAAATTVNVARGSSASIVGVVETAGGSDYVRFAFVAPSTGVAYRPQITLSNSAGGQYAMNIQSSCGVTAGCSTTGGGNNESGAQVTVWEQNYNRYIPGPGCCFDTTPRVTNIIVRMFRAFGDAPTCSSYTVTATNF